MRLFLLPVVFGVLLMTTAQVKNDKAPPKKGTPPASSPSGAAPAASAPEPPWLQMEMAPLEKEIVKQHRADIRAVQSKKPTKKAARGAKLPPDWQKKIARGEILPETVYAQAQPLPEVVIRTLPPPPAGTILVTLDDKVLRLLEATRTIVDVFELK
jgi:hypothetical protein